MKVRKVTPTIMFWEMAAKYAAIVGVFFGLYLPTSIEVIESIPVGLQESLISFMGFLMAAAIIGAFELSYLRTNLDHRLQRYLAHWTKLTLYSSIMLLTQIGIIAVRVTYPSITMVMVMASGPILLALILYDFWDAVRALDVMGRL